MSNRKCKSRKDGKDSFIRLSEENATGKDIIKETHQAINSAYL